MSQFFFLTILLIEIKKDFTFIWTFYSEELSDKLNAAAENGELIKSSNDYYISNFNWDWFQMYRITISTPIWIVTG